VTVAIVGSGPYGLSIAAHFRAAGIPHRLFGQPMHTWVSCMPEGMVLRSEPFACSLWDPARKYTYNRFCATHGIDYRPIGLPPTRERFLDYATWFRQHAVGDVGADMVRVVRRRAPGFTLELTNGTELTTDHVILATGFMAFRHVPEHLAAVRTPLAVHSSCLEPVATYAGRNVTIVGAGQSALESAALLHEAGANVRVIARTRQLKWNLGPKPSRNLLDRVIAPYAGVGAGWKEVAVSELPQVFRAVFPADKRHRYVASSFGPAGAWWLRKRVAGRVDVHLGSEILSAREEGGQVVLEIAHNGATTSLRSDQLVAATGFRVDLARLNYLDPSLLAAIALEGHAPRLDARFETSIPGLFIVGAASAPTFGPVMRFMFGAKHVAPALVRRLRKLARR